MSTKKVLGRGLSAIIEDVEEVGVVEDEIEVYFDDDNENIEIKIISILRLSGLIKKIISKYHSKLSNLRNIQSINIYEFEKNVKK